MPSEYWAFKQCFTICLSLLWMCSSRDCIQTETVELGFVNIGGIVQNLLGYDPVLIFKLLSQYCDGKDQLAADVTRGWSITGRAEGFSVEVWVYLP